MMLYDRDAAIDFADGTRALRARVQAVRPDSLVYSTWTGRSRLRYVVPMVEVDRIAFVHRQGKLHAGASVAERTVVVFEAPVSIYLPGLQAP